MARRKKSSSGFGRVALFLIGWTAASALGWLYYGSRKEVGELKSKLESAQTERSSSGEQMSLEALAKRLEGENEKLREQLKAKENELAELKLQLVIKTRGSETN
ncbi:MAG: hypothetical protein V2A74_05630 [bacterium]